jgi:hypothetical protein
MLACIPLFWRATINLGNVTSNWQGWMLSWTVKDCFMKFCRKDTKSNQFKLKTTMKRKNAIMAGSSSAETTFDHNDIFFCSACWKILSLFGYWIVGNLAQWWQ